MKQETKEITEKVKKILANFDLSPQNVFYFDLVNEGVCAREFGMNWRHVEALLEERIEDKGLEC